MMTEQETRAFEFFRQQDFLPTDKDAYPVLNDYAHYSRLQEMSATLIITWSLAYNGLYKIIYGYLCIVYFQKGKSVSFTVHRPLSPPEHSLKQIVDILYGLSREAGLPSLCIKCVEERFLDEVLAIGGYEIQTGYSDDSSEYVYRTEDFINLAGGVNLKKRQRLAKCLKNTDLSFRPITNAEIGKCLEIEEEWCRGRDCEYCRSFLGCEKEALEIMIDIFDESRYQGLFLCDRGVPVGYSIAQKMSEDLAFMIFGKAIIQDGFVYVLFSTAKICFADINYVNLDEDMGNTGLRLVKQHLGSYELWRKYICTFTKTGDESL
jgi:hypothetical protein